jgi:hypothetical protein
VSRILRELAGLFVDDGSLAVALVIWAVVAGLALPHLPLPREWDGPILFLGCVLILLENLRRSTRRR